MIFLTALLFFVRLYERHQFMYTSQLVILSNMSWTRWLATMTSTYPTQLMLRGPWTYFVRYYDLLNLLICLLRYLFCKLICYTKVFSFIVVIVLDKVNWITIHYDTCILIMNAFEINTSFCLKEETHNIKRIFYWITIHTLWYMHIIIISYIYRTSDNLYLI